MSLNAIKVLNLKPKASDYRVADGGGLYVLVRPNGSKLWRYDYRLAGARRTFSIGAYSDAGDGVDAFTLKQARDEHDKAREAVKAGQHPISPAQRAAMGKAEAVAKAQAKAALANHTFGAAADIWLAAREVGHSAKTYDRDQRSVKYLKTGYRGAEGFGDLPVDQVGAKHLSAIAKKLNRPTRRRVVAAARKIMAVARSEEWITTSPFSDVDFNAGTAKHKERKRPAITDEAKFGELLRKIDGYAGTPTWYGLQLLALTFVRPGTVTKARWQHFDLEKAQWVIPFKELKMEWLRTEQGEAVEDFTVPLSRQAVALLRELHKISGGGSGNGGSGNGGSNGSGNGYLFPGPGGGDTIDEQAMNDVLHALGYKGIHCAHGFRSSASTILNRQRTPEKRRMFDPMLIEMQLDHQDNSTRAIYDRDDCLPERIEMMQFWADKVDELREGREGEVEAKRTCELAAAA